MIDTEKRNDPFDKVKFVFMADLAEMERNLIRERKMEGDWLKAKREKTVGQRQSRMKKKRPLKRM